MVQKLKHFDRERETMVIETQDEKAAALHHLCIATSHMLVSQCFTFTLQCTVVSRNVINLGKHPKGC